MHSTQKPKDIKNNFLSMNSKYEEIVDHNAALGDFFNIDEDDDEVWILQCPKGSSISLLKDQKLKLPGRSNHEDFETVATEYPEPIPQAFGHKNKKAHNVLKIVPIRGSILMRSRLKAMPPPECVALDVSFKVPMPKCIKERHPLLGVDFQSKLSLPPDVAKRLKHADDLPSEKHKSKKKSKNKSSIVQVDSDEEVELVLKKKKKKKRKNSDGIDEDDDEVSKKKKRKRSSQSEDVSDEMQWIQRL